MMTTDGSANAEDAVPGATADGDSRPDGENRRVRLAIRKRLVGRRLDSYLRGRFPRMSRTTLQRLIQAGEVTVNGLPTKPSYEPNAGDLIEVNVPPPPPQNILAEDIPLDVIYEDDHLLVLNKQAGIICHPAKSTQTGTLANGLVFRSATLGCGDDPYRPGIVHRLDKNTTGVMLIAKSDEAHWRLSRQFEKRTVRKTYWAILEGSPQLDGDRIDQPLGAHPRIKDRFTTLGTLPRAMLFKDAVTDYQIVERYRGFCVAHLFPKTGRTHQLRIHMSAIGHPILGDTYYGGHFRSEHDWTGEGSQEPLISHQCLHALRIKYVHPIEERPMMHEAPPPPNLQRIHDLLKRFRTD